MEFQSPETLGQLDARPGLILSKVQKASEVWQQPAVPAGWWSRSVSAAAQNLSREEHVLGVGGRVCPTGCRHQL